MKYCLLSVTTHRIIARKQDHAKHGEEEQMKTKEEQNTEKETNK